MRYKKSVWGFVSSLSLGISIPAQAAPAAYTQLINDYFQSTFENSPSFATSVGIHTYDHRLEDFSLAAHQSRNKSLNTYLQKFSTLDPSSLTLQERDDREMVIANIQANLLEETGIQMWRHNPDIYPSAITASIFTLIKRNFAPLEVRMGSVIARERQIPAALTVARSVLVHPPRIYTEIAIAQIGGSIDFFQTTVAQAFTSVKDPVLRRNFARSNAQTISALQNYQQFLKKDLLPKSKGNFAIGEANYRRKLAYEEMVDLPLEQLLEIGTAQLRKDQAALLATAKRIDPTKTPREVQALIEADHPTAQQLIPAAQQQLDQLRQFLKDHQIMTVPGEVQAIVEETPPFLRATTFASMDTPGPYEVKASEAYYNITLPNPSWSAAKQEDYLRAYNYPLLNNVSVHEVWPGHYAQFLWVKTSAKLSKVRKLLSANSNTEGWAHYAEQMMLDEGLGNDDPKLRFAQLIDALLRDCRFIVGIKLHTQGMTFPQAVDFLVQEGYQQRVIGEVEAKRGTGDPTYLVYTLGKLEILKLREDYRLKMGDQFSLRDFHDRFIQAGALPIKILRRELLGQDSPAL